MGFNFGGFAGGLSQGLIRGQHLRDMMDAREERMQQREMKKELGEAAKLSAVEQYDPEAIAQAQADGKLSVSDDGKYQVDGQAPAMKFAVGSQTLPAAPSESQLFGLRSKAMADVYDRHGNPEKAMGLRRDAGDFERSQRAAEDNAKVGAAIKQGLEKAGPNLTDAKRDYKINKTIFDTRLERGDYEGAMAVHKNMVGSRDALLEDEAGRTLQRFRATNDPMILASGLANTFRLAQTGNDATHYEKVGPDSVKFTLDDGKVLTLTAEQMLGHLGTSPAKLMQIERARIEQLRANAAKRDDFSFEQNNKVHVLKDENGNESFGTAAGGVPSAVVRSFPKSLQPRLAEINKGIVAQVGTEKDTGGIGGKLRVPDENTMQRGTVAAALLEANPNLSDELITELTIHGERTPKPVSIAHPETGRVTSVPAVFYKGKIYPMVEREGATPNNPVPDAVHQRFDALRSPNTQTFRQSAKPGLTRNSTPTDFPRVTPSQQTARDVEAGKLLVTEAGGVVRAGNELSELDSALKNPRLDGSQRRILQGHRDRLAAGIAALS